MTFNDVYEDLLVIVSEAGARPDMPYEAEIFFTQLVDGFEGSRDELLDHVRANVVTWFRSLDAPPDWLQDAEWAFFDGRPMVFVGQIELPPERTGLHDAAAFFVFWDREAGVTETVIQIA